MEDLETLILEKEALDVRIRMGLGNAQDVANRAILEREIRIQGRFPPVFETIQTKMCKQ